MTKASSKNIYLALDLWRPADTAGQVKGKRGGNVLTCENVNRRMGNSELVPLVAGSRMGASMEQTTVLGELICTVLATGRVVNITTRHSAESAGGTKEAAT